MSRKKQSITERELTRATKSLRDIMKILEPYAPKRVGTIMPDTAEWQIAEEEEEQDTPDGNLRHATEPAA
jgi:hypothetical protein